MGNCIPFRKNCNNIENSADRYQEVHNELLKEKLVTNDIKENINQFTDQIRAVETRMEMSRYEVDMALQYIGQTLEKIKKQIGLSDEDLENL